MYNPKKTCFLDSAICISEFKYSDSVERSLYLNNHDLASVQEKQSWINLHSIYPEGGNGYWNNCKAISKDMVVCSFQSLVNIPRCKPYSVSRYPIKNWKLELYQIHLLDRQNYLFKIELYKGQKTSWMLSQKVNLNQEVLCDP